MTVTSNSYQNLSRPASIAEVLRETSFKINDLTIKGFISTEEVVNYLSVPFATIPARWRQSKLLDPTLQKGTISATAYGYRAPQSIDELHDLMSHLVERPSNRDPYSEHNCLQLNIYAPANYEHFNVETLPRLPILVRVHGGGLNHGENSECGNIFLLPFFFLRSLN